MSDLTRVLATLLLSLDQGDDPLATPTGQALALGVKT